MADILIRGGTVLDGTGKPGIIADVAIENGVIIAVGRNLPMSARQIISAENEVVTPGFVDIHRHGDTALFRKNFGFGELQQGITTIVNGNCGMSAAPSSEAYGRQLSEYLSPVLGEIPERWPAMEDYLRAVSSLSLPVHTETLAGLGSLRVSVCGYGRESLTDFQKKAIQRELVRALEQGAIGVSLGLGYAPECFLSERELAQVLEPLKGTGIPLTAHIRQEGAGVTEAADEMIRLAEKLQIPVEISHMKAIGREHWGKTPQILLQHLQNAVENGLDIACDVYPYTAGSTQLTHILPPESKAGGVEALCRRLQEKAQREKIRQRMETGDDFENIYKLVGFENILVTGTGEKNTEGKSLAELAEGNNPFDTLFDMLLSHRCKLGMIDRIVSPQDLETLYSWERTSVISDSTYPSVGLCHPRVWGTFPRFWQEFCIGKRMLSREEAVRRMTSLPASRLGLKKKGLLAPGMDGDVLVFSPEEFSSAATYENPEGTVSGLSYVLTKGKIVLQNEAQKDGRRICGEKN